LLFHLKGISPPKQSVNTVLTLLCSSVECHSCLLPAASLYTRRLVLCDTALLLTQHYVWLKFHCKAVTACTTSVTLKMIYFAPRQYLCTTYLPPIVFRITGHLLCKNH